MSQEIIKNTSYYGRCLIKKKYLKNLKNIIKQDKNFDFNFFDNNDLFKPQCFYFSAESVNNKDEIKIYLNAFKDIDEVIENHSYFEDMIPDDNTGHPYYANLKFETQDDYVNSRVRISWIDNIKVNIYDS